MVTLSVPETLGQPFEDRNLSIISGQLQFTVTATSLVQVTPFQVTFSRYNLEEVIVVFAKAMGLDMIVEDNSPGPTGLSMPVLISTSTHS